MSSILKGFLLTAQFEVKAAKLFTGAGLVRLMAEPIFYSAFVVSALASRGGGIQVLLAEHLAIGVIGIQCIRMVMQVIYRWTLERKWSLGSLKLSSGVPRVSYYLGMLLVPLLSLLVQAACILGITLLITSFQIRIHYLPLAVGILLCGLFWSAVGCVITAIIKSYRTRDFVVAMLLTPLMFSAPTLYSLEQVPALLRAIASVNPLTYQLDLLRSAAGGAWTMVQLLVVLALTLTMTAIGFLSTARMRTVSNEG